MVAYCTLYDVKKRLQIEVGDVTSDPELEDIILEAQALMDEDLKKYVSVPLSSVPDLLKYACADLASSLFKGRRIKAEAHGDDLAVKFEKDYRDKLAKYVGNIRRERTNIWARSDFEED